MNQEIIGKFIKQLREEKGWTQELLAQKIFIGREAISKWERGKTLPESKSLEQLCKVFDISLNELLCGERNTTKNIALDLYEDSKKIRKKFKILFNITILLVLIMLFYYFITQYKSVKIFTISGESKNFQIYNGLYIKTNEKIYLNIGEIINNNHLKINKIELSYLKADQEIPVFTSFDTNLLIVDYYGYNEYFNYDKNDLYLKIYYDNYNEIIKLNFTQDYLNNKFFIIKNFRISKNDVLNNNIPDNEKLINKIKEKFDYKDNTYKFIIESNTNQIEILYNENTNTLLCNKLKNQQLKEEYYLILDYNLITYTNYENEKINYSFNYDGNFNCTFGTCNNVKSNLDSFYKILSTILS